MVHRGLIPLIRLHRRPCHVLPRQVKGEVLREAGTVSGWGGQAPAVASSFLSQPRSSSGWSLVTTATSSDAPNPDLLAPQNQAPLIPSQQTLAGLRQRHHSKGDKAHALI